MRGGGGGEGGLGTRRSSPELVLSVSMAAGTHNAVEKSVVVMLVTVV